MASQMAGKGASSKWGKSTKPFEVGVAELSGTMWAARQSRELRARSWTVLNAG